MPPNLRPNDNDMYGPIHERLSHARHSATLLAEYLDDFARQLHPDFVGYFWHKIDAHVKCRLTTVTKDKGDRGR